MEPVLILSAVMLIFFGTTQTAKTPAAPQPAALSVPTPPPAPPPQSAPKVKPENPGGTEPQKPQESTSGWNGKKEFSSKKWK